MGMNHLNLTVADVSANRAFFETYFGFRFLGERGRNALVVLVDESGFTLTLSNFDKAIEVTYPAGFHVGFIQREREQVDEIHARMEADGLAPEKPREFHGAWTFYIKAPGGYLVEVLHMPGFA